MRKIFAPGAPATTVSSLMASSSSTSESMNFSGWSGYLRGKMDEFPAPPRSVRICALHSLLLVRIHFLLEGCHHTLQFGAICIPQLVSVCGRLDAIVPTESRHRLRPVHDFRNLSRSDVGARPTTRATHTCAESSDSSAYSSSSRASSSLFLFDMGAPTFGFSSSRSKLSLGEIKSKHMIQLNFAQSAGPEATSGNKKSVARPPARILLR